MSARSLIASSSLLNTGIVASRLQRDYHPARPPEQNLSGERISPSTFNPRRFQPGQRQDNSAPVLVFAKLAQSGWDVSAQINNLQIGPNPAELTLAPDTSGRDHAAPDKTR